MSDSMVLGAAGAGATKSLTSASTFRPPYTAFWPLPAGVSTPLSLLSALQGKEPGIYGASAGCTWYASVPVLTPSPLPDPSQPRSVVSASFIVRSLSIFPIPPSLTSMGPCHLSPGLTALLPCFSSDSLQTRVFRCQARTNARTTRELKTCRVLGFPQTHYFPIPHSGPWKSLFAKLSESENPSSLVSRVSFYKTPILFKTFSWLFTALGQD